MQGFKRKYLAMPSRQTGTGGVFEVYHPITREARQTMEQIVTDGYARRLDGQSVDIDAAVYLGSECADFTITGVRVRPFEDLKLRGFASIVLDECLAVNGIKIIAGKRRSFVQMPNVKKKTGKFRDLAFPTKPEIRELIERTVFQEFEKALGEE
jgi:stage V sporulation protein G